MSDLNINFKPSDNIIAHIPRVVLASGDKDGHKYYYLDIFFKNGYSKRVFLNNESLFIIMACLQENVKNTTFDED
jgi:hypothetical protein